MTIPILFEDQHLLVVCKPPGLVVNQADTVADETLQGWFQARLATEPSLAESEWSALVPVDFEPTYGTPSQIFAERGGVVHRLDKDTSGVIVLAKNPGALIHLLRQFKNRETEKKYLALVHGKFQVPEATISEPMGRASRDRKVFAVRPDGRAAVTAYKVVGEYANLNSTRMTEIATKNGLKPAELARRSRIYQGFSLVECWPKTGRTHQIRVHLAHIQHPVVGDTTYVGRKRQMLDPLWCPRQFLHAAELRLTHPVTGELVTFAAPVTPDLEAVLTVFE